MPRIVAGSLCAIFLLCLSGCGSKVPLATPTPVSIDLSLPANTMLLPGQTAQFSASVSNAANTNVFWEVNSIVGGNAQVGTITTSGLYTAPSTFPSLAVRGASSGASSSSTVTITAAAAANTSASATATVTLLSPPVVSVSPATATIFSGGSQQFSATVTNSTNSSVIWQVNGTTGGSATVGTVTSTGLYTAPASVTGTTVVTVTAVSSAYSGSSASASVTVKPAPAITVSPTSGSVMATKTLQFTSTVSDSSAVTWEVNSAPGGNPTIGTVSSTGLYTAPAVIPNPATVTVSAVSVEDPSIQANVTVTITPLLQIVLTVSPSNNVQPLGLLTLTASSTIPNDTLVWKVNTTVNGDSTLGTITATGPTTADYMAPDPAPSAGFVTVYAYSSTYPTIFGSANVTIGNQPPGITVTPGTANVALADTQQFSATVSPSNLPQDVTWSVQGIVGGNATVGTICNAASTPPCTPGLYTAPALLPASQTPPLPNPVTITATSTAEPNPGTASVTVVLPASVSVAVNPTNPPPPASLMPGETELFVATVTPANIPDVKWSLSSTDLTCDPNNNPNACGGITPDPSHNDSWNITYTAPSLPASLQSANVTLTATSLSDPAESASITVTITANPTIAISPATNVAVALGGVQAFTANLAHVPANTTVFWNLGCMNADDDSDECPASGNTGTGGDRDGDGNDGPGTISSVSGLSVTYTAPAAIYYVTYPSVGCPPAVAGTHAFVPLTASMTVTGPNGSQLYSAMVCIQVGN